MTSLSSNVTHQVELLEKLHSRQALIGIVGLGYVGLPLSLTYAEVGYRVLGLDIDQSKADAINKNRDRTYSKVGSRIASSTIVKGKDCSNVTNLLGAIETSRMDNDTNRMGILVGNETQRYDIDKRFQMGLKQIQAGQVQNVFGGGAQAMMGGMAQ